MLSRRSLLAGAAASFVTDQAAAQQPVACALVLAVDVSASVNAERFHLQRRGYIQALTHPSILRRIGQSPFGAIAACYFEWASLASQRVIVPWRLLRSQRSLAAFASVLETAPRPFDGMTAIGAALDFSQTLFDMCPFPAPRRVVDISGDGVCNDGSVTDARDRAIARGIVVNGLPIDTDGSTSVADHYRDQVVGGENAFTMPITDFATAGYGLMAKLSREIS